MHKAYKTLCLINHPDHNVESAHATEKFQVLVNVHDFLLCAENRKLYDDTGKVGAPSVFTVSDETYENCKSLYQGKNSTLAIVADGIIIFKFQFELRFRK